MFEFFKRLLRGADGEPRFPVPNNTARGVTSPESEPARPTVTDPPLPPAASGVVVREVQDQGYRIRLDLSRQVLRLDIPEDLRRLSDRTPRKSLGAAIEPGFVPGSALVQKAKQFDDGLYAAVELAAQTGAGTFAGKATLLRQLIRDLASANASAEAQVLLIAAGRIGGLDIPSSPPLESEVTKVSSGFLSDEVRSKPLGFYTWSPELEAIFRQDRLLQTAINVTPARAVALALEADPVLVATYRSYLGLMEGLTNPFPPKRDILSATAASEGGAPALVFSTPKASVFPASRSHEGDLVMKLYGGRDIPEGFDLMDEMIGRMRTGTLDVTPTAASGWYDYQTWSHEPLVIPEKMPEAARLSLSLTYRAALVEMFKGAQALARETHVKQLEMVAPGCAMPGPRKQPVYLRVSPELTVEPLPTYYLRRAVGYAHVRTTLTRTFGDGALAGLHRQSAGGPAAMNLDAELHATESLFWGAYHASCRQIGLPAGAPLPGGDADAHVARFTEWAAGLSSDEDVGGDARMMVPVFFDIGRQKTKVWIFLGWVADTIRVEFKDPPRAHVFDRGGREVQTSNDLEVLFLPETRSVAYPVMAEVYVTKLLDRDEFRRHCDRYVTQEAILDHLA